MKRVFHTGCNNTAATFSSRKQWIRKRFWFEAGIPNRKYSENTYIFLRHGIFSIIYKSSNFIVKVWNVASKLESFLHWWSWVTIPWLVQNFTLSHLLPKHPKCPGPFLTLLEGDYFAVCRIVVECMARPQKSAHTRIINSYLILLKCKI